MLLLFDIDGTLVLRASREHAEALFAALRRVHGLHEIPRGAIDAAGRTDGEIARAILLLAGVSAERIDARATAVREMVVEEFARRCPADLSSFVSPGIADVVAELHGREDRRLSLLTGNFQPVARLKLARAGLGGYFPAGQGAFGSDDEDRAALPEIARARAGVAGRPYPRERTIIIGDTPRDIACARADGVRVIAIATGTSPADDLRRADVVVSHPRELPDAIDGLEAASSAT
jgi:phosphoglycolate phosphatase